jgi:hypothetical protein
MKKKFKETTVSCLQLFKIKKKDQNPYQDHLNLLDDIQMVFQLQSIKIVQVSYFCILNRGIFARDIRNPTDKIHYQHPMMMGKI